MIKKDEGRHTSPEDGDARDSRKVDACVIIRLKAPCLHLAKGISIVKKLKERALCLPGKLPAPTILAIFRWNLGAGVRSR